jgi:hypothetical protein
MQGIVNFTNRRGQTWAAMVLILAVAGQGHAWENILGDPGFEDYSLDEEQGYYVLDEHSPWYEITMGRGSVTFDASDWTAPQEMTDEIPQGFSPGTTGFEGTGAGENSGRIIIQQDVVRPELFEEDGRYEAWIWLGGAGNDDETNEDRKDEAGGWEIFFYGSENPQEWKESDALEYHSAWRDFSGKAKSFVQVCGFGRYPKGARGFRFRVWAGTWTTAAQPRAYDTAVAVDNAHFAVVKTPNMLANGDFTLDANSGEFVGWDVPARWPFPKNGLEPLEMKNVNKQGNFDHGIYRPYFGYGKAYGYATYLRGWHDDAMTFSQVIEYEGPEEAPLLFTFYWLQDVAEPGKAAQVRRVGSDVDVVIEYLNDEVLLAKDELSAKWPIAGNPDNDCRYDQNAGMATNPRWIVRPAPGTNRIAVNVSLNIHLVHHPDLSLMSVAVDDFYLGLVNGVEENTGTNEKVLGYLNHVPPESPEKREARIRRVRERRLGNIIIVHRGASKLAPENTLEAYAAAMDYGADGVEIDIRRSKDGVLYIHHDSEMGRTLSGSGPMKKKTYYEIASAPLTKVFGTANNRTRAPTLAAVVALARQRAMLLHLDIKESDIEDDIIEMFDQADLWKHVVFVNWGNADKIHARDDLRLYDFREGGSNGPLFIGFGQDPHGGELAFGKTTNWGTVISAGCRQQIDVEPGQKYECLVCGLTPKRADGGGEDSVGQLRLGVHPFGGTDPKSLSIIWTPWISSRDGWKKIGFEGNESVEARHDQITVFLEYRQEVPTGWNGMYFDDASVRLYSSDQGEPVGENLLQNPGFEADGLAEIFPPKAWHGWGDGEPDGTSKVGAIRHDRMIFTKYKPTDAAKSIGRQKPVSVPLPDGIRAWWMPEGIVEEPGTAGSGEEAGG